MKKFSKRFIALLMAIVTTFCITITASAAEIEPNTSKEPKAHHIEYEVTSEGVDSVTYDGIVQPRSSISGYENATFEGGGGQILVIPVVSSGVGGMGITVKTSSSWNGYVSMRITDGDIDYVNNYAMPSNGERQFHNLTHYSPMNIGVLIYGIPAGKSMRIDVWVYG